MSEDRSSSRTVESEVTEPPDKPADPAHRWRARQWRWAQVLLALIAVVLVGRLVWRTADYFWFAARCPYELEYGEGILLQNGVNIARGAEIYNDYTRYPYVAATYPPVYPAILSLGVKAFGVSFAFGRAASLAATLGIALFIWLLLRRAHRTRLASALGTVLFIAAPIVTWWGPSVRVDMTAVFFGIASVYCAARGGRWLIPAVVLMGAAFYTRQSEVAPIAAAATYLWSIRDRRKALMVGGAWAGLVALAFVALQVESHGWFYRHVVVANQNRWELQTLTFWWLKNVLPGWPFPFVLGLVGAALVVGGLTREQEPSLDNGRSPVRLFALYWVFAMLVSLTAGKIGATINYMLEPLAASCVMTGIAYDWLAQRTGSRFGKVAWVGAWLLLILVPVRLMVQPDYDRYAPYRLSRHAILSGGREVLALIRRTKGDVLSEDTGMLVLAGRRVLLDPHKMTSMFRDGNWDQGALVRDIKRQKFALIISRWDPVGGATDQWNTCGDYRWSIGMGHAIMRSYYLVKKAGNLYITAPADANHPSCGILHARLVAEREQRKQRERLQ